MAKALTDQCVLDPTKSAAANVVQVLTYYGPAKTPSHVTAPATLIDVPAEILQVLGETAAALPKGKKGRVDPKQVGWELAIDRDVSSGAVVLRITTLTTPKSKVELSRHADQFRAALGVSVRLELGMLADAHADKWAHRKHSSIAPGISIGSAVAHHTTPGATITVPVQRRKRGKEREFLFLTVGHAFSEYKAELGSAVRQPVFDANPNRVIGSVEKIEYSGGYLDFNFFDAALVTSTRPPTYSFGEEEFQFDGAWLDELPAGQQVYIYGATSGLVPATIEHWVDLNATVLSLSANSLIYRDMISFRRQGNRKKASTKPGDSGAPLLIQTGDDRYKIAGIVIGGGSKRGENRRPRSLAVPIGRVLDHFDIDIL